MRNMSKTSTVAIAILFMGPARAEAQPALWESPGWKSCIAVYKKIYNAAKGEPVSYSYDGSQCGPSSPSNAQGCVMAIFGPDRSMFADRKSYEITLNCGKDASHRDMVCTNRRDRYNPQLLSAMRTDPRCSGFPKLASENLSFKNKKVDSNTRPNGTEYRDLPASTRYGNDNKDAKCYRAVARVRALENDPRFESDRSIRLEWQKKFDAARALGCNL